MRALLARTLHRFADWLSPPGALSRITISRVEGSENVRLDVEAHHPIAVYCPLVTDPLYAARYPIRLHPGDTLVLKAGQPTPSFIEN